MIHRGEILEKAVRNSGYTISFIAKKIHYNRKSMYDFFENALLPLDILIRIGSVINHDFSMSIPELNYIPGRPEVNECELSTKIREVSNEKDNWKEKYYSLLEEHIALLKTTNK